MVRSPVLVLWNSRLTLEALGNVVNNGMFIALSCSNVHIDIRNSGHVRLHQSVNRARGHIEHLDRLHDRDVLPT